MAGVPLFHNFLDTSSPLEDGSKRPSLSVATGNPLKLGKNSVGKNSVLTEEERQEGHHLGTCQSSSVLDGSAAAPMSYGTSSPQRSLQMDMDALDSSRPLKKSRLERPDDAKRGQTEGLMDGLVLTMQPPRTLSKPFSACASLTSKLDRPAVVSKAWDHATPAPLGTLGPCRKGQKGKHADNMMADNVKDSVGAPIMHVSPADEGSRTGLKGSSIGSLLDRALAGGPGLSLGCPKLSSRDATSESTFVSSQEATPITRQLTIFYGGQAHVFEDVSSEKAEAIMTLAGSSGRSWSTVYSSRPKPGIPWSASERSVSTLDKERRAQGGGGGKPSTMNASENNRSVSTEIQNAFRSVFQKASGTTDTETTTDQIRAKPEEAQTQAP